jgi:sucrose-6-phosphate hydrolase SacC (GH32 family)
MMNRREFGLLPVVALAARLVSAGDETLYDERYRPQFHFSPRKGWTNDPNGLVFYRGEYHLFFQHNPFDTKWGNMTWGHAVSPDLVHWQQLANAIEPDQMGTIFSGSAVVDEGNTAGLESGAEKTLVAIYAAAGGTSPESKGQPFTQCLAYSNDRGRTWSKYAGNPVVPHLAGENRDPKVVWHAPTRRWIMVLFLDGNTFRFLASPNLKKWTPLHDITVPGAAECPDFFPLPIEGEPGATKWVFTAANDHYLIGTFDGQRFVPEVMTQPGHYGKNYYAVQTYSGLAGARRVQVGWMAGGEYPGMPFNQQMSFPYELTLRRFGLSLQLCALPVREIEALRKASRLWNEVAVKPGDKPLADLAGELWDIEAEIAPGSATDFGFVLRGRPVTFRVKEKQLSNGDASAGLSPANDRIRLRILVDRTSVEVFGNDGEVVIPCCFLPAGTSPSLEFFSHGGTAQIAFLKVHALKSIWR